jgi:hypothetical protein
MKKSLFRPLIVMMFALSLSGFTPLEALFAPKADLWERWLAHDAESQKIIDHGLWQAVLTARVKGNQDGVNRVAYGAMSEKDDAALGRYLDQMRHVAISAYNRDEQLAYWINVYNAATVHLIRRHYPLKSIRDIEVGSGLFTDGAWDHKLFSVEGEELTLNDIEHRILRPVWKDPRLHYALNCASIGCPNLNATAYSSANSQQLLNESAVDFVNHPRGVSAAEEGLRVSKIYLWFAEDFGGSDGVLAHLKTFAFADLAARIDGGAEIVDYNYDWSLNE